MYKITKERRKERLEGGSSFPSPKVGQANHSTILNASGRIRNAMREGANLFVEAIGLHLEDVHEK